MKKFQEKNKREKLRNKFAVFGTIFSIIIISLFAGAPEAFARAGGFSSNWAGYVAETGYYTSVEATWTMPVSIPVGTASSNAEWIGIGGHGTPDLIQAGTLAIHQNGGLTYYAWVEMLPLSAEFLHLQVRPGDSVTVSLQETSLNLWHLYFKNNATGEVYERNIPYVSSHTSAEWIEELPLVDGSLPNLANFQSATFGNALVTENGVKKPLAQSTAKPITLIDSAKQVIASPGGVSPDGASFSVQRTNMPALATPTPLPLPVAYQVVPAPLPAPAYAPIPSPFSGNIAPNVVVEISFSPTTGAPVYKYAGAPVTVAKKVAKKTIKKRVAKKPEKKIAKKSIKKTVKKTATKKKIAGKKS